MKTNRNTSHRSVAKGAAKAPPSIDQVARRAGVSIATVSRVVNGSKPVAEPTRARVQAAIDAMGFRTSAFGRALSTGRSGMLMVLVPTIANPYYAEIVRGAAGAARTKGHVVVPVDLEGMTGADADAPQLLAGMPVDGVVNLLPLAGRPKWLDTAHHLPWINCSEFLDDRDVPYVSIDHALAATEAVQYLINRGHRRIALVNSDERFLYAQQRRLGYQAALSRAGLRKDSSLIVTTGDNSYAAGEHAAARLLTLAKPPTAVFAVSDTLAIGAIKGLRRGGRRIPDDVAVIGFDDLPIAEVFEPALTTVAQPMLALGAAAVEMLLERLAGAHPKPRVLPHRLVLRDSA